ncbi:MAG TPA: hypothetical protein VLV83_25590 [Acidobacteriota bacterium]|nr:hypothetical protein [Acidobacteriota bacterium]
MKLYDIKAKRHGESYDAVSALALDAEDIFRGFADDFEWQLAGLVSSGKPGDDPRERIILHAELNAPRGGHLSVDFVRYENNRLGVDNKIVIRAFSPRGELASSVLRGLKLISMQPPSRSELLRNELERMGGHLEFG